MLPVRRLAEEAFSGSGGPLLLAGSALHTDLTPESATSSFFGWLLAMLGHQVGFPVPEGGAGQLTAAMVRRLESKGGTVLCRQRVAEVVVRKGNGPPARHRCGRRHLGSTAVMADIATTLFGGLVPWDDLPSGLRANSRSVPMGPCHGQGRLGPAAPVPWRGPAVADAGTVHLADSIDEMTQYCADIAQQRIPARPFVLAGQMTTADPSRSPAGTEVLWAYTHVPRTVLGDAGGDQISGAWTRPTDRPSPLGSKTASRSTPRDSSPCHHRPSPPVSRGSGGPRRQPGRWCHQRRHQRHPPAACLPTHPWTG